MYIRVEVGSVDITALTKEGTSNISFSTWPCIWHLGQARRMVGFWMGERSTFLS